MIMKKKKKGEATINLYMNELKGGLIYKRSKRCFQQLYILPTLTSVDSSSPTYFYFRLFFFLLIIFLLFSIFTFPSSLVSIFSVFYRSRRAIFRAWPFDFHYLHFLYFFLLLIYIYIYSYI